MDSTVLDLSQLQAILAKLVTYKPGWEITVFADGDPEGYSIRILTAPDNMVEFDVTERIPPFRNEEEFLRFLQWRILRIEIKSCHEWFKVNGRPFRGSYPGPAAEARNRLQDAIPKPPRQAEIFEPDADI